MNMSSTSQWHNMTRGESADSVNIDAEGRDRFPLPQFTAIFSETRPGIDDAAVFDFICRNFCIKTSEIGPLARNLCHHSGRRQRADVGLPQVNPEMAGSGLRGRSSVQTASPHVLDRRIVPWNSV